MPSRSFYYLEDDSLVELLMNASFANIKQIKTGKYKGSSFWGLAPRAIMPARMLLTYNAIPLTGPHEWGHACGLYHRNQFVNGTNMNPGPIYGLMNSNT